MARVEIRVSDLSHEPIQDDSQAARLIVEHPDYPEPIGLDVLPSEVQEYLTDERKRFVVVSLEEAGNLTPQERYVLSLDEFERLFQTGESRQALEDAFQTQQREKEEQIANRRRSGSSRRAAASGTSRQRELIDYSSPEHAGEPHRGTISEAEKAYIRVHLDEVNERLRGQGVREIDPNNPMLAERYGLLPQPSDDGEAEGAATPR